MGLVSEILGFISESKNRQQKSEILAQEKEKWALEKERINKAEKQQQMMLDAIEGLPPEMRAAALLNKEFAGKLMLLSDFAFPSTKQPQQPPPTVEQTGELFRPTQEMLPKQSLPSQITNQLFGGMTKQDMMRDILNKEMGIGRSAEPVKTEAMPNPQTGQVQMGQILRDGTVRWLKDPQENPLIAPPDVEWKQTVIGNQVVEVAFDKKGNVVQQNGTPLIRSNIPQNTQFVQGALNNRPANIALPPGGVPPGTAFPGAVSLQIVPTRGPQEETGFIQIDPYGGGRGPSLGGGPAIGGPGPAGGGALGFQTGPAKAGQVAVSQQIQMVKSGLEGLKKIKDALFDHKTGEINRNNLANAKLGTPWTEGKRLADLYGAALNAVRIASTGAAFSPQELKDLKSQYVADVLSNDQQIYEQWDMMTNFLGGMLQQLDPDAVFTSEVQKQFQDLKTINRENAGSSAIDIRFKQRESIEDRARELSTTMDSEKAAKQLRKEFSPEEIKRFTYGNRPSR